MRLSVCMMVKIATEQDVRLMRGALNSIAYVADEVCIVDTFPHGRLEEAMSPLGDDGELLYAQASLGPITTVLQSPWRADFAFHRNQSLDMATGGWVLVLDHDEVLTCPNPMELKRWLDQIDVTRAQVCVNNLDERGRLQHPFNQARLFRRGSVHYEGRAHHQPMPNAVSAHCSLAHIDHYGYGLSPEAMEAKRKRTEDILLAWRKEEPTNQHISYWLAKTYSSGKDHEKAAEHASAYLRTMVDAPTAEMHFAAYWLAAHSLLLIDRPDEARRHVREGLERKPEDPDLLFLKSELAAIDQDWDVCREAAAQFVKVYFATGGKPPIGQVHDCYTMKPECISMALQRVAHISLYAGLQALGLSLEFLRSLEEDQAKELSENSRTMIHQVMKDIRGLLEIMRRDDKNSVDLWIPEAAA